MGFFDDPIQDFGNPGRVAHFFLITDQILKDCHLFDFLKSSLANSLVRRLGRYQKEWRVVPVGRHNRGHEVGDAGAVLGNGHAHFPRSAGVAIGTHASVTFMGAVPEFNACCGKQV